MTTNSISSQSIPYATIPTQQQAPQATPPKTGSSEDTVHLSQAGQAASGDIDHDGDSH